VTLWKLWLIWLWFTAHVLASPCLTPPNLVVADIDRPGIAGTYTPTTRTVTVEAWTPKWVAVHEMAHHYWYVCHIASRPVGRWWLNVTPYDTWDRMAKESWAATFTWVLTGATQGNAYPIHRDAARTFGRLIGG